MKKALTGFVVMLLLAVAGIAVFLLTFDPNNYRDEIADALSKQTGRSIKFNGAVKIGFSTEGVTLSIHDAAIGNPSWASRPDMVDMGRFKLDVALLPLLNHQLVITGVTIQNADIQLESAHGENGALLHNWELAPTCPQPAAHTKGKTSSAAPVEVHIHTLAIKDSRLAMSSTEGKMDTMDVKDMTLGPQGTGITLDFSGSYDNTPVTLNLKAGLGNWLAPSGSWPLRATSPTRITISRSMAMSMWRNRKSRSTPTNSIWGNPICTAN